MNITTHKGINGLKEFVITHQNGQEIRLLNVGASLIRWLTPAGQDIVAAYENHEDYLHGGMYLGTNVGLVAGRLENSQFSLNQHTYQLKSKAASFLHGGDEGIAFKLFHESIVKNDSDETVIRFVLPYKNEQLPGEQVITITYVITANNVKIVYDVTTSEPCICNMTNHSYFNLNGDYSKPLFNHWLSIAASKFVQVNNQMIGTTILETKDTPYDFSTPHQLLDSIEAIKATGLLTKGIDHYFIFDKINHNPKVILNSKTTNLSLSVTTDYPGVTIYTTNYPTNKLLRSHHPIAQHGAICIEMQYQSNAINDSRFPVGLVTPEKPYHQEIHFELRGE